MPPAAARFHKARSSFGDCLKAALFVQWRSAEHPGMRIPILGPITADTAANVRAYLAAATEGEALTVEINSDGGSVAAAVEIFALLTSWRGSVETIVSGWALSAASLLLMAGGRRTAHATSLLMVHAPGFEFASGNAAELRESAAALDTVAASMRAAYARTGQPEEVIARWLSGPDFWFTAEDALAVGLLTQVVSSEAQALSREAIASCRHPVPSHLRDRKPTMPTTQPTAPAAAALEPNAAARLAELERQADIRAAFKPFASRAGMQAELEACLADPSVSAAAANQRILAQMAKGAGPVAGHYVPDMSGGGAPDGRLPDFIAAARDVLLIRAGVAVKDPHPATKDLRRLSVASMAERVLSMHGRSSREMSADQVIRAALTTDDFPNLLNGVGSKALLAGYEGAATTHAVWTGERETRDFKPTTLIALSESPALEEVREAGEYKHGALQEAAETFRIATFGKIVTLSRQALVNDDLGAFTSLAQSLGAAARRLEADMVYGRLTANPVMGDGVTLFHANHGNLAASGGALDLATLGAARAAMRKQKGVAGLAFLDPQPRFLIVPVTMETAAEALLRTLTDPSASANGAQVEWVRNLTLVADPRLDAVSTSAWYLACAPQQLETIARCYLQGEERPHLEEREGWERDVHEWKVRLDFAAAVIGWRGLYKNPGA